MAYFRRFLEKFVWYLNFLPDHSAYFLFLSLFLNYFICLTSHKIFCRYFPAVRHLVNFYISYHWAWCILNLYALSHYYLKLLFMFVWKEISSNVFLKSLLETFCKDVIKITVWLGHFIIFCSISAQKQTRVWFWFCSARRFWTKIRESFNNCKTMYYDLANKWKESFRKNDWTHLVHYYHGWE